jgi:hypothetical protein
MVAPFRLTIPRASGYPYRVPTKGDDAELYLSEYPRLKKWINQCVSCGRKGYRPDMPEHIGGPLSGGARNLRTYFSPRALDDAGRCLMCSDSST